MLYEVRVAANKGLGVFARHPIPRGTRILAEEPLIALQPGQQPSDILTLARQLDKKGRRQLLELSWHPGSAIKRLGRWGEALGWALRNRVGQEKKGLGIDKTSVTIPGRISEVMRDLNEAFRILGIFRSNSFNLASPATSTSAGPSTPLPSLQRKGTSAVSFSPTFELALFPGIARINHSCIPNAQANYHSLHRTFNVHATRDILAGEEVSINYLPENGHLRDQRVVKLEDGYGFTCNCLACDLSTKAGQQREETRKIMQDSMRRTKANFVDEGNSADTIPMGYGADGMPETLPSPISEDDRQRIAALRALPKDERQTWLRHRELEVLESMLNMYATEGVAGREVASIRYRIARLQWENGDGENAIANAEAGLKFEEDCLGADHPEYLEASAFVEQLREKVMPTQAASPASS